MPGREHGAPRKAAESGGLESYEPKASILWGTRDRVLGGLRRLRRRTANHPASRRGVPNYDNDGSATVGATGGNDDGSAPQGDDDGGPPIPPGDDSGDPGNGSDSSKPTTGDGGESHKGTVARAAPVRTPRARR